MSSKPTTNMKVIFGTMTIGKPGIEMTRVHTLEDADTMVKTFLSHGHKTLDTARVYGQGSCEEYLGNLDWPKRGISMDTKLYPTALRPALAGSELYHHSPEDLRRGLMTSLKALKADKLGTWYLHAPDRTVPWEETLATVNQLHQEGHFEQWGVCNFQAWEVARVCDLCEQHGWVKPAVYQGLYNALHRAVEAELFPCLRHYGMSFYCFNPLAAGFLTSRYTRDMSDVEPGSRFDPNRNQGKFHRERYFDDIYFDALDILRPVAKKHGLTEVDCALGWLSHHSGLKAENGDGIVLGASSAKHLEENLVALERGPLPAEVVEAIDRAWKCIQPKPLKYWH